MWIDPIFRAEYRANRAVIALDGRRVEEQWAFARNGAALGKLEVEHPSYLTPAARFLAWARSRVDGVEIGSRLGSAWPLEGPDAARWLWLGEGPEQGMRFLVRSARRTAIEVELEVSPGPGRPDGRRTLRLSAEHDDGAEGTRVLELDRPTVLRWPLVLEPGTTRLRVEVLDHATVVPLPNGDTRGLLVSVHRVTIVPADETPG